MDAVLKELDKWEFAENIESELEGDNIAQSCYTNFKDILVKTIIHEIHEMFDNDNQRVKYFEKNKEEKIFNAFMENKEFKILLSKKVSEKKELYKKVIVKLDFSEEEKKKIAETYVNNILEGYCYLDICVFVDLDEINVDTISKALSDEVYGLLTPEEIKMKFKDKIEKAINLIENGGKNYE